MADCHTREIRSINMSHIKSTNTKPEEKIRKFLFSKGFRYRKNVKNLPGCPDIVLPKHRTIIFVNGCFWHKHNCSRFRRPASNQEYWHNKITGNVLRDASNKLLLENQGWKVLIIWECETKKATFLRAMDKLIEEIERQ